MVQPAAGDAGGSLGASLAFWFIHLKKRIVNCNDDMKGSYLGPSFNIREIKSFLDNVGQLTLFTKKAPVKKVAKLLSKVKH